MNLGETTARALPIAGPMSSDTDLMPAGCDNKCHRVNGPRGQKMREALQSGVGTGENRHQFSRFGPAPTAQVE
jgi:hypothetical protein